MVAQSGSVSPDRSRAPPVRCAPTATTYRIPSTAGEAYLRICFQGCLAPSSVLDVTRQQFDHLSGLGKRQLCPQEGSKLLNDPTPLQVDLPSDGITVEKLWGGGGGRGTFIVHTNRWRLPRGPSQ
jgi:hypothetical protein